VTDLLEFVIINHESIFKSILDDGGLERRKSARELTQQRVEKRSGTSKDKKDKDKKSLSSSRSSSKHSDEKEKTSPRDRSSSISKKGDSETPRDRSASISKKGDAERFVFLFLKFRFGIAQVVKPSFPMSRTQLRIFD
jgi:hypothetical protein